MSRSHYERITDRESGLVIGRRLTVSRRYAMQAPTHFAELVFDFLDASAGWKIAAYPTPRDQIRLEAGPAFDLPETDAQ